MSTTLLGLLLTLLPTSIAARAASAKKAGDESADQKEAEARWKASGLLMVTTKASSNEVPLQ
jgi:hypothetical protein